MRDSLPDGTPGGAPVSPAAYRGGMARIRRQSQGQPAVVVLSDLDRELLAQALDAYVYTSGLSAAKVAAQLGVARPYLYRLISADHIEVERLIKLQELLDIYLLSEGEVEEYVNSLRSELLGRPLDDSCFKGSPYIETSLYYVAWYLLADLEEELAINSRVDPSWRERRSVIEFAWEDSDYHLRKLYEYCSSVVQALHAELTDDDKASKQEIRVRIPIVGTSDYWLDFEDRVSAHICSKYFNFSSLDSAAKSARESDAKSQSAASTDDALEPWVQEALDRELAYHEAFCQAIQFKIDELESDIELIERLCESRERALRRTSYRLSELHEVAENLEDNSFLLTPKHKKSIVEWLAKHQPTIELVSDDNWWSRKSEFRCKKCGDHFTTNFRYLADSTGPCQCSQEQIVRALGNNSRSFLSELSEH